MNKRLATFLSSLFLCGYATCIFGSSSFMSELQSAIQRSDKSALARLVASSDFQELRTEEKKSILAHSKAQATFVYHAELKKDYTGHSRPSLQQPAQRNPNPVLQAYKPAPSKPKRTQEEYRPVFSEPKRYEYWSTPSQPTVVQPVYVYNTLPHCVHAQGCCYDRGSTVRGPCCCPHAQTTYTRKPARDYDAHVKQQVSQRQAEAVAGTESAKKWTAFKMGMIIAGVVVVGCITVALLRKRVSSEEEESHRMTFKNPAQFPPLITKADDALSVLELIEVELAKVS